MKRSLSRGLAAVLLAAALACGGGAELGEACEETGATSACVDGGICDTVSDESEEQVCLALCDSDEDCNAATESCTGVSGSNQKACHRK